MKKFSKNWVSSIQVRKQRKYRYNAPLHRRQKMMSAHLERALRKEYKKRSLPVRKGDEVKVVRGNFKGKKGNVSSVDMKNIKIYIENIKRKKVSGQEVNLPLDPSNVIITRLQMDDKKRRKVLTRKR